MADAVLHCYADYKWTGSSEPVVQLCRELCRCGWHVELACSRSPGRDNPMARRARDAGLKVHQASSFYAKPTWAHYVRDMFSLSCLIEERGYRIVHAHGGWDHVLAASALDRGPNNAPLVRTDQGAREYSGSLRERLQFGPRWCKHLIVLTDRLRARAVERLRLHPSTVTTIRGAIDADDYRPMEGQPHVREQFGLDRQDVIIGVVARVQRHRRFEVLLEAAREVCGRNPRVKIVVLGRGTQKGAVLDRPIEEMGLQRTVYPLGYRRDDYRQILAMLDAGLMLVPGSDGSCRAAMQMAAMAKPLVVADRGVLPDIVLDGETGIVVRDTAEYLAEAILEMAGSRQARLRWGRAARERMKALFNLDRQARAVADVYRRLLGR